jgi:asparagine synthetase B (glutamine-hydrolysing)
MAALAGLYAFPDADPVVVAEAWRVLLLGSRPGSVRELGPLRLTLAAPFESQLVTEEVDPRRHSWGFGGTQDAQLERAMPPWLRCDYDVVAKRARLRTDRYGFAPLYWRQLEGSVAFSTSALLLAHLPPLAEPDPGALAELIAFDHLLGERTHARGVTALSVGHHLLLDPSGVRLHKHYGYADIPLDARLEARAAVPALLQAWRDSFAALVRRAASRRIVVPLSGGLDSRLLAATAAELGASLETFTFGQRNASGAEPPDVTIARQVAGSLSAPWRFLELKDGWVSDHAELACRLTDGHLDVLHSAGISFGDDFQGDLLRLDGLAGDIVLGGSALLPPAFRETSPEARFQILWRTRSAIDSPQWQKLLLPDARRELAKHARAALQLSIADATNGLTSEDPRWLDFWVLRNRIRRFTTNGALLWRPVGESAFPFFALEFLDRLLALHPRHRLHAQLQAHFLHQGYPAMASIPWQKTGRPVARPGWLGRLAHHLSVRRVPPKYPFFDFDAAFRRTPREQEFFRARLLGPGSKLASLKLFDQAAVASLFDRTLVGEARGMRYLSLLLTLALAVERRNVGSGL